jgi:methionyl-tRNA synthetase
LMDRQAFHEALEAIWVVIRAANGYVDHQAPWALRKTDEPRMRTVLYVLAETIRHLGLATLPFMPETSDKILDQLSITSEGRSFASAGKAGALQPGTPLPKPQGVFPRYVEEAA